MAEINKLSVGEALDKLRRTDVQNRSKRGSVTQKMDALDEDIQRMRATRGRLERDQRAAVSTASDAQEMNARPGNKKGPFSNTLVAGHPRCRWPGPFGLNHPLCDAGAMNVVRTDELCCANS